MSRREDVQQKKNYIKKDSFQPFSYFLNGRPFVLGTVEQTVEQHCEEDCGGALCSSTVKQHCGAD